MGKQWKQWQILFRGRGLQNHCKRWLQPWNVMYGCDSWAIKKAEHWRTGAFELKCWRRFLRVPWTARISNQSILKEINPECSLEGPMLKLKLQYFGHLRWRTDSLEKTLMLGKIECKRSEQQRMRQLDGITNSMDMSLSNPRIGDVQGRLACCSPWSLKESDTSEQLNWYESFKCSGKRKISH